MELLGSVILSRLPTIITHSDDGEINADVRYWSNLVRLHPFHLFMFPLLNIDFLAMCL
jgi:hypothetical protein